MPTTRTVSPMPDAIAGNGIQNATTSRTETASVSNSDSCNCTNAVRATMCAMSRKPARRRLVAPCVNPIQHR